MLDWLVTRRAKVELRRLLLLRLIWTAKIELRMATRRLILVLELSLDLVLCVQVREAHIIDP